MRLSERDAGLFFDLMWSLQYFVNQNLNVIPDIDTIAAYQALPSEGKLEARDALYDNPNLIDRYITENPDQRSASELAIIEGWKNFVRGNFYIERYLKKYTIFIGEENVYGVLSLFDPLSELIHKSHLPLYVKAVLLPFKGQIIYDGLFQSYNVHFGGGVKGNLKEQYMQAKQRNAIITSFDQDKQPQATSKAKSDKDWQPVLEELAEKAKKLRGGAGQPAINGAAFSLVKASLDLALACVTEPIDAGILFQQHKKANRALKRVEDTIYRTY